MSNFDVVLDRVSKTFPGGARAVIDFNAEIKHGEFVAMLGPSGCGKTTTLRMIGGLEEVTDGKIFIAGKDVTETLNGASTAWTFGNLVGDAPKISMMMNRHNARGWTCQRVLSAVRNAVIDVKACAFKISDQGVQAADKIAELLDL